MTPRSIFLRAVLGPDGAEALERVAKTAPALDAVLVPRAALAWVAAHQQYAGAVPGAARATHLLLRKAEGGYDGSIVVGDESCDFRQASGVRVAAAVVMALGDVAPMAKAARDVDLARLGRTVDRLVRARFARKAPQKPAPPAPQRTAAPAAPPPPARARPTRLSKKDGVQTLRLSVSESLRPCPVCRERQFEGPRFRGCYCFRDLAKAVSVETLDWGAGFKVTLGRAWDREAFATLVEALGLH